MTTTNNYIKLCDPNFHVFCIDFQKAIKDGYVIDFNDPPVMWGRAYECGLVKEEAIFKKPPTSDGEGSGGVPTMVELPPYAQEKKAVGRPPKNPRY